ncbi:MAG: cation:proton antiporter [Saprospiraceae bacterium]|nr:cation:proton antiporter [Saprospiraceae bacterium]
MQGIDLTDPYVQIASATFIIILSFVYGRIARKTRVPSVLMLIGTGIAIKLVIQKAGVEQLHLMPVLQILGILGAIMIVLEAALELHLDRDKIKVILRSFFISLLTLVGTAAGVAVMIQGLFGASFLQSMLYAVPLGILSSVILIPSIEGLNDKKKEGLVYETSFSDILGIMFFYFLINMLESGGPTATLEFGISLVVTIVVAILACYGLVFMFKDIQRDTRLFLLIAVLLLLYSLGVLVQLSPLLFILVFGLFLANHERFFRVFKNWDTDEDPVARINEEFHLITKEASFVIRTFFFVIFGMTIDLASLLDGKVLLISLGVLAVIFVVRFLFLRVLLGKDILPEVWLAPRGLVSILLYFAIPATYQMQGFSNGVLLYVIILTSLVMTFALMWYKPPPESGGVDA